MDIGVILGSLIEGAAGAGAGSAVTYWLQRRKRDRIEDSAEQTEEALTSAFRDAAVYEVEHLHNLTVIELDGNGSFEKSWHGVKTEEHLPNLHIPHHRKVVCPDAHLLDPDVGTLSAATTVRLSSEHTVNHADRMRATSETTIEVHGPFPGASPADFCLRNPFQKAFCMTWEELKEASSAGNEINRERTANGIRAPTERVTSRLELPEEYTQILPRLDLRALAFHEWVNALHENETDEIEGRLIVKDPREIPHVDRPTAILEIEDPKPGIMYAISWKPPAEEVLAEVGLR